MCMVLSCCYLMWVDQVMTCSKGLPAQKMYAHSNGICTG